MEATALAGTRWYAVHTKPQSEKSVTETLKRLGYWTFYPFHRVRRRRKLPLRDSYFVEWVERPFFQRYVFVALRHAGETLYWVNETPGVSTVVHVADRALEIPHPVMDWLMALADDKGQIGAQDNTTKPKPSEIFKGKVGDQFTFAKDSPFSGLVGRIASFEKLDSRGVVRAWLKTLGEERLVDVPHEAVAEIITSDARRG